MKEQQDLARLIEENKRLKQVEERFKKELDVVLQALKESFTEEERERFDIRYSHTGIVNGAILGINFLRSKQ
jgi:hypothetical protein